MKELLTKNCLICNKEFKTYNSVKDICPGECRKTASRIYAKEYMRNKRAANSGVIVKVCIICHKEFNCHKSINDVTCLECQIAKTKEPARIFDTTKKDSEGIIYGI